MKRTTTAVIAALISLVSWSQVNMSQLGHLPYAQDLSDVWGYVDEEGNEYALVGVFNGLSVVNVTDKANPVEVFFGPGESSIWRDIKTWGDYAYVSNESGGGVYIADLSPLPGGSITNTSNFTGDNFPFQTIHNLYIDESGKLYIFGSNNGNGGAIICDLTQDPMNPVELGRFNDFYLHDGMARGDTLWGAGIYAGVLAAIDVSDPSSPGIMGTVSTPSQFAHNAWVSDDGSHVFTTDEVSNGYIGAFNVSDVTSIYETDRIRSSGSPGVIPHNVHVLDDFLITSYYSDGIVVHDANYPDKLIEVANFDTSPNFSGDGYNGSWGAYPYLPSGVILASDIEEGLYILDVEYIRGAFLEGVVTDESSGSQLFDVQVEIVGTGLITQTAFDGSYEFGTTISGTFDIKFSKDGYNDLTIQDVSLLNGEIEVLDVELESVSVGLNEAITGSAILTVYPNPFKSSATVEYNISAGSGSSYLSVYNMMGVEVERLTLARDRGSISFGSKLASGFYLVKITSGDNVISSGRIIKR